MRSTLILFLVRVVISERSEVENALDTSSWNTCEEFVNTTVQEKSIVGVKWKMFYHWGDSRDTKHVLVTFSRPAQAMVKSYQALNISSVSWRHFPLYMARTDDRSGLLVRSSKPGIYSVLTSAHLHAPQSPVSQIAFKTSGEYLAIMNCRTRFCSLYSSSDHMPVESQMDKLAALFNFRGGPGLALPHSRVYSETADDTGYHQDYIEEEPEYV